MLLSCLVWSYRATVETAESDQTDNKADWSRFRPNCCDGCAVRAIGWFLRCSNQWLQWHSQLFRCSNPNNIWPLHISTTPSICTKANCNFTIRDFNCTAWKQDSYRSHSFTVEVSTLPSGSLHTALKSLSTKSVWAFSSSCALAGSASKTTRVPAIKLLWSSIEKFSKIVVPVKGISLPSTVRL